jgi:hypothetical protein
MQLTEAMLQAAVRKAVEVELLPKAGFIDVRKEGWRQVKAVVEAALAEADEECESRLDRARAAYDALREAIEVEHGRALIAESERDAITRLLVVESLAKGDGWYVQEDLPPKVKGRYPTFDAAMAVVRKAAGLDAAPAQGDGRT